MASLVPLCLPGYGRGVHDQDRRPRGTDARFRNNYVASGLAVSTLTFSNCDWSSWLSTGEVTIFGLSFSFSIASRKEPIHARARDLLSGLRVPR